MTPLGHLIFLKEIIMETKKQPTIIPASKIPKDVWAVMISKKPSLLNHRLGKKYKLSSNQVDLITVIESQIFYKELSLQDFPKILQEKLNLNPEVAQKLSSDIYDKLFSSLKDYFNFKGSPIAQEGKQESEKEEMSVAQAPSRLPIPELPSVPESPVPIGESPIEAPRRESEQTGQGEYQIRTMKQDIEKAKRGPIPPKPEPETSRNVVDLSNK
jgi:hypothetical protein